MPALQVAGDPTSPAHDARGDVVLATQARRARRMSPALSPHMMGKTHGRSTGPPLVRRVSTTFGESSAMESRPTNGVAPLFRRT